MAKTHYRPTGGHRFATDDANYNFGRPIGNVLYVNSSTGTATGPGFSPETAYSTLDAAIGGCTANNDDVIVIAPGHTETQAAAGALATFDIAGVRVIGLGQGTARPTFTLDHADADFDVTAAGVTVENCRFIASAADVTHCFDVTAKWFTLKGCEFLDDGANDNFVDVLDLSSTTNNNADGLTVIDCVMVSDDTGNDAFIEANADVDRMTVQNCYLSMGTADAEPVIVFATGKDATNVRLIGNQVYRLNNATNGLLIQSDTSANSGIIALNLIGHLDTQTETPILAAGARIFQNYATAADSTSGYLLPTADS